MRSLLLRIVLTVLLVLSLFLLLLRIYLQHISKPPLTVHDMSLSPLTPVEIVSSGIDKNTTSAAAMKSLFLEENRTLEKKYKTVASEIMDYVHSRKINKKEDTKQTQSTEAAKKFVSRCRQPVQKMTHKKPEKSKIILNKVLTPSKPKLVIIMDDVSSIEEAEMIRQLPFQVTPSIFPVTSNHPDTPEVARMFPVFMIHMPMEAYYFDSPEEHTLYTDDTLETIEERVAEIKADFPDLTAINNHTGSKFTSDRDAMDKLFCALGKYDIPFVDSRTSVETKAREMAKLFHEKVLERNVFLDNEDSVFSVLNKLKEAVAYAKEHQTAIAICHPKPTTFAALMQAKPLLKGVEVVTIDKLYSCKR